MNMNSMRWAGWIYIIWTCLLLNLSLTSLIIINGGNGFTHCLQAFCTDWNRRWSATNSWKSRDDRAELKIGVVKLFFWHVCVGGDSDSKVVFELLLSVVVLSCVIKFEGTNAKYINAMIEALIEVLLWFLVHQQQSNARGDLLKINWNRNNFSDREITPWIKMKRLQLCGSSRPPKSILHHHLVYHELMPQIPLSYQCADHCPIYYPAECDNHQSIWLSLLVWLLRPLLCVVSGTIV